MKESEKREQQGKGAKVDSKQKQDGVNKGTKKESPSSSSKTTNAKDAKSK